jgi:hypothetical protein
MSRWALLALVVACGTSPHRGGRPDRDADKKRAPDRPMHRLEAKTTGEGVEQPISAPPTVVLIITDTVRADHTSLCGYDRPTTPTLRSLSESAAWTCAAYAPGTWTIPSHASYFTGLHTTEHNLLNKGIALDPDVATLAEIFAHHGYQTAMISANPTLTKASGLWQGFSVVNVPKGTTDDFRYEHFDNKLEKTLKGLDATKPLFLVVNIFDAHDPYPEIPGDVAWLPKRPGIQINPEKEEKDGPAHRLVEGKMSEPEAKKYLQHLTDTYDWGIFRADRNVAKTAQVLQEGGWLANGYRLVVTSDHGEHLGEHGLIRHDGPPWETVTRVFTLFKDTTQATLPALPEPFANAMVFWLLKDGRLPDPVLPVASASIAYESSGPEHARRDSVALWPSRTDKLMWSQGPLQRFDLTADPEESHPIDLPADDARAPELERRTQALLESKARGQAKGVDPEVMKSLEAIGYIN